MNDPKQEERNRATFITLNFENRFTWKITHLRQDCALFYLFALETQEEFFRDEATTRKKIPKPGRRNDNSKPAMKD